jgi:hypothetical protein
MCISNGDRITGKSQNYITSNRNLHIVKSVRLPSIKESCTSARVQHPENNTNVRKQDLFPNVCVMIGMKDMNRISETQ